jgi:hypothetical protein
MLSGTGYPSGENYPAGTGIELFFYPHAGTGNPTGKILRVRVRVGTTRRVHTRCHLESHVSLSIIDQPIWARHLAPTWTLTKSTRQPQRFITPQNFYFGLLLENTK